MPPPGAAIPESWLDILDESIRHRGPDGEGRFRDRAVRPDGTVVDVAMVHRRLAIIDPACGHQPMVWSASRGLWPHEEVNRRAGVMSKGDPAVGSPPIAHAAGTPDAGSSEAQVAVVFNGCIYNHRELRRELQAAGHRFETDHSDTEVLVHGWRAWGPGVCDRLDGMYAFAIWDRAAGTLALARDRMGEKPLYITDKMGPIAALAFASTAPALARLTTTTRGTTPAIDRGLLARWIAFGFGGGTPSRDTTEVHPGAQLIYRATAPPTPRSEVRFHNWPNGADAAREPLTPARVDHLLAEAVASRLDADVPIGCFLSGGLDSPLIAALAQRSLAAEGRRLRTFTVRMPDPRYDESAAAALAASHLGVDHVTLDTDARPGDELPGLVAQMGLPFGDSSLLPTYWVSREARRHVKVALSGDGGDELFCGYERHIADRWLRRYRPLLARVPLALVRDGGPRSRRSKARRLIRAAREGGYPELVTIFQRAELRELMPGVEPLAASSNPRPEGYWFDRGSYLSEDLLRKTDAASMTVALEARCPMLSAALIKACFEAPEWELMPRGQRKGLLRQVARRYLPAEIVDRPKQGFAIPIGEWFRSDYGGMRTLLLDYLHSAEPWGPPSLGIDLNMKFVKRMLDEHLGTGPSGLVRRDHSQRLYMLLVLSIWAKWLGSLSGADGGRARA